VALQTKFLRFKAQRQAQSLGDINNRYSVFFAGALFPIDVLPVALQKIIYLTPFPYLVFFPLKIWLEQVSLAAAVKSVFICFVWLVFFYWLAKFLWRKGARNYGAYGG